MWYRKTSHLPLSQTHVRNHGYTKQWRTDRDRKQDVLFIAKLYEHQTERYNQSFKAVSCQLYHKKGNTFTKRT